MTGRAVTDARALLAYRVEALYGPRWPGGRAWTITRAGKDWLLRIDGVVVADWRFADIHAALQWAAFMEGGGA